MTSDGLSLSSPSKSGTTQTQITYFNHASLSDYDTAVGKLGAAGAVILAKRQRALEVEALDREADQLSLELDRFVAGAQRMMEQQPGIVNYYSRALSEQQSILGMALRLASGNDVQKAQSHAVVAGMNVAKNTISNASAGVDRAIQASADKELALNAKIRRFSGICLGEPGANETGQVIPNMGSCKALLSSVAQYKAVLDPLHSMHIALVQSKAKNLEQLALVWKAASNVP